MNGPVPDPNNPRPTPDNPNPEPARPPSPPETPPPVEPPGVPSPSPDPVPAPEEEPIQIPPGTPPEVPSEPSFPGPRAKRLIFLPATAVRTMLLAVALSLVGLAGPASANSQEDSASQPEAADPCQIKPQQDGEDQTESEPREDQPLSEALDRCNGVLVPPQTGDREIEEPPPDTGTTPVIPPESLPGQPSE